MNLLFVCTENKLRSATAEAVFSEYRGVNAIGCGTNKDALTPISGDLVEWADVVFVMEPVHRRKIVDRFGDLLRGRKLVCLDIPDRFGRMAPELIRLLHDKVAMHIRSLTS